MTTLAELTKEQATTNEHLERIVMSFDKMFQQQALDRLDMMERQQEGDGGSGGAPAVADSEMNAGAKKVSNASSSESGGFGLFSALKENVGKLAALAGAIGIVASLSDEQVASFKKLGSDLLDFTEIATGINFETINAQFSEFVNKINELSKKMQEIGGLAGIPRFASDSIADMDLGGPAANVVAAGAAALTMAPKPPPMTLGGRVEGEVYETTDRRGRKRKRVIVRDPKTGTLSSQFAPKDAEVGKKYTGKGGMRQFADKFPNWAKKLGRFAGVAAIPIATNESISAINANRDVFREAIRAEDVTNEAQFAGEVTSGLLAAIPGFLGANPRNSQTEAILFTAISQIGVATAQNVDAVQRGMTAVADAIKSMPGTVPATPPYNPADHPDPLNPMSSASITALNQSAL